MSAQGGVSSGGQDDVDTETDEALLTVMWGRSKPVLLSRVDRMSDAVDAALDGREDGELLQAARRAAHQVAGSAGMFGYRRATEIARELERLLAAEPPMPLAAATTASTLVRALRSELETPRGPSVSGSAANPVVPDRGWLLITHPDRRRADELAAAAAARGFHCLVADDLPTAQALIVSRSFVAVLLDLQLAGGRVAAVIGDLAGKNPTAPILVTGPDDLLTDRVAAIQSGARGFVSATLTDTLLIDALVDALVVRHHSGQRLLAVDDDPIILDVLRELFAPTGLALTTLQDPLQFWDILQQTSPDLLLLDIDMPAVTGLELCRLVRSDPHWEALPVLVLTGANGTELAHSVYAAGADDYVPKPIVGEELLTRVRNRLDRVRLYRQLAETDPLTGLYNRRKFTAEFDRLQRMSARYQQPLTFALLDLDKFKSVNDRYGHSVGDGVLQRLGTLLSQHFRGEDLVARWGGEEIALGLYGMSRSDAVARVMSALAALREETFSSAPSLRLTFSAGVALHGADGDDLRTLYRAADEVLYRAKALGGNRVFAVGSGASMDTGSMDNASIDTASIDNASKDTASMETEETR